MLGRKVPQCDHFEGLQKKQRMEQSWQIVRPASAANLFHDTELQNRCQNRPLVYILEKKNDAGVENKPSFKFAGHLTMASFLNPKHVYPLLLASRPFYNA